MHTSSSRFLSIDIWRTVAILLVMGHHMPMPTAYDNGLFQFVVETWQRGGWIGVDLFFVLSGFLVSGLLFREHRQTGRLRIGRFLARRGLKIYPAFYFFILVTVIVPAFYIGPPNWRGLIGELVFLQNYLGGMWLHTWSLAVEEHFYIMISLLLLYLFRRNRSGSDPFRYLPRIALVLAVTLLALRIVNAALFEYSRMTHLYPTHLRIDALMFGVLLAYFYHYHSDRFVQFCSAHQSILWIGGIALLTPAFFFQLETTPFIYTVGLTMFYLGSGLLLSASLVTPAPKSRLARVAGYIGSHSYSIYLWHLAVRGPVMDLIEQRLGSLPPLSAIVLFMTLSIVVGIVIANLIEFPVLRLRDRWFPSLSPALRLAPAEVKNT